ncbi:MAG: hypothetical protein GC179_11930 [Anaerolineaceae bacterium]|nr:hypothetical protein [Anaerolineaceae bacterium]
MNKVKFAILMILGLMLSVASVYAQEAKPNTAITLERTACFGSCPIYTIKIYDNGDVVYHGDRFVMVTEEQKSQIDSETVKRMVKAFEDAGYFDWKEAYNTQTVTDLPSVITSVTSNGKTHRIVRYVGDGSAPLALVFLERWIDTMTNSNLWTGDQSNIAYISNGMNRPIITLQRDACFGTCPVYTVAAFEDGTIVYTGIAHVKQLGVQVIKADTLEVSVILQKAQALGYFDWQDSYTKQVMTDQATVTSSIRMGDELKQIVRYNGDSSAPVGLVWVEESIDQLVMNVAG